jgi:membrane protease YdiL (CAAX protease family)
MPAFLLIPAGIAHFTHLPVVQPRPNESVLTTIGVSVVVFTKEFLFAGLLEESGWRGWLLPRLQQRWSPLIASLFVWLPWALWHAPLDFTGGVGRTWMSYIQVRVVFFIAISILLTWFLNRSGGSIVVAALFHASFNTFPFVFPYSPPFLVLILVWSVWVVISDRMWRSSKAVNSASACEGIHLRGAQATGSP